MSIHKLYKEIEPYFAPIPIIGGIMTPVFAAWSEIPQYLGWPLTILFGIPVGVIILGIMGIFIRILFPKIFLSEKDMITSLEIEFNDDSIRLVSERNVDDYKNITGYCIANDTQSTQITILLKLKYPITISNHRLDIVPSSKTEKNPYLKTSFGVVSKGLSDCIILTIGNIDIGRCYRIFAVTKQ